jgi:hypothetical protein
MLRLLESLRNLSYTKKDWPELERFSTAQMRTTARQILRSKPFIYNLSLFRAGKRASQRRVMYTNIRGGLTLTGRM